MGEKEWREINAKTVILSRVAEAVFIGDFNNCFFFKFYIISSKCHLNIIQLNADCMLIMVNCSCASGTVAVCVPGYPVGHSRNTTHSHPLG